MAKQITLFSGKYLRKVGHRRETVNIGQYFTSSNKLSAVTEAMHACMVHDVFSFPRSEQGTMHEAIELKDGRVFLLKIDRPLRMHQEEMPRTSMLVHDSGKWIVYQYDVMDEKVVIWEEGEEQPLCRADECIALQDGDLFYLLDGHVPIEVISQGGRS